MSERNKYGDIILTKEEQKELYYRLTHPDAEALKQRDEFLAECPELEYDENGCIVMECGGVTDKPMSLIDLAYEQGKKAQVKELLEELIEIFEAESADGYVLLDTVIEVLKEKIEEEDNK